MSWGAAAPTLLPLGLAGALHLVLAAAAWPRRALPGARIAILNATSVALFWCGAHLAQLVTPDLAGKLLWQKVRFLGAAILPASFVLQALQCTGRRHWITRRGVALLAVVPVLATLAVWTSEWHGWAFHHLRLVPDGALVHLAHEGGPALRGYVLFAGACGLAGAVLLAETALSAGPPYRAQALALLGALSLPWLSRLLPWPAVGLPASSGVQPLAFVPASLIVWAAVFRLGLLDLVPIARATVVEGLTDAILVLDPQERIVDLNPAAARLLGAGPRIVGRGAAEALAASPAARPLLELLRRDAPARGQPARIELSLGRAPEERVLEASCTPIALARDGTPGGRVVVLHDVTERSRVQADLARARAAAEAASAAKSEFLARTSHELRTPLGGILGLAELLLDSPLADEPRRRAEALQSVGRVLRRVLDDVLASARLEAGRLELAPEDFAPRRIVSDVIELFAPGARAKGLALEASTAEDVPAIAHGDPARLHQALSNLVANAVKFTDAGGVTVSLSAVPEGPGALRARFEVADTGPGVAPDVAARLFEPFTQADPATTRRFGGSGLGLAICRQLAELMGGSAGVASAPGRGSTFWFTARLEAREQGALAPAVAPRFAGRVLLADDHAVARQVLGERLERLGCRVDLVPDGRQAVERACADEPYDLVLLDVNMPALDGYAAAAEIRRREGRQRRTPIVALSAGLLDGEAGRLQAADVDGACAKPLDAHELAELLERFLAPAPEPPAGAGGASCEPPPPALLAHYYTDAADSLAGVRAALLAGDREGCRRAAHRLRGGSLFVGATRLAELCARTLPEAAQAHAWLGEMERELQRFQARAR